MELAIESSPVSNKSQWLGRGISALVVIFLLLDSIIKLIMIDDVIKASAQLGYTTNAMWVIGLILLVCTILYIIPRTSILGAILLTGYLGGAVASNLRIDAPLFSHILFPIYFGILIWGGLYLRNKKIRTILPLLSGKNL